MKVGVQKPDEHRQARKLRAAGVPIKHIASEVGVSPSTVHAWTRDIELTPEQLEANRRGPSGPQNPDAQRRRAAAWAERARERRRAFQEEGRLRAREGDPLHQSGCMLFWAEGSKRRNVIVFVNSDLAMVRHFRRFLVESLGVTPDRIAMALNVYTTNGLSIEQIEAYWLEALELEPGCVRKHTVNHLPTSSSGNGKNKLPYGVCRLVVHDTRLVQHIYGAIQEYAGVEEPRWLD